MIALQMDPLRIRIQELGGFCSMAIERLPLPTLSMFQAQPKPNLSDRCGQVLTSSWYLWDKTRGGELVLFAGICLTTRAISRYRHTPLPFFTFPARADCTPTNLRDQLMRFCSLAEVIYFWAVWLGKFEENRHRAV